ncbi:MAG: TolC family protein [Candidatus Omnitrophica bacterium]|nr:TolC family protein [Candidatus Omnitrophota bacterium]
MVKKKPFPLLILVALMALPAPAYCEVAQPPVPAADSAKSEPAQEQPVVPRAESAEPAATGLIPYETPSPEAATEAAAESGITEAIERMRAADRVVGEEGGRTLNLKDSIFVSVMNNRSIQVQEEEVEYAKGDILYAKSLFLPKVNAEYSYTYNDSVFYSDSFPGHRKDTRIYSGFKNDNAAGVVAEESIYNGGANIANLKQANIGLKIARETLRAAKLDVEFETKRLFYGLLLAYETKRIAQDLVDQAEAHYIDVKANFGQGTASKFDVLQSKVQVSTVIPQLVNADNAVELITVEFKKLLVLNLRDPVRLEGRLAYKEVEIHEEDFLQEAYKRRPEMILKLLGVDLNKWAIDFAKAGWLPQVSATASYMYRTDNLNNMVNPRHDLWNVGVKASIALFDGFATKAKVDEAKARYNEARLQKEDYVDQLAVDVRNACLDLKKAKALIDSQKDSVDEAKEALRLSVVRFNNGVGTNLDVFDAEVSLAQVQQNLAQGVYDYIMAKAQLDRLRGRQFSGEESWQ